uniref:Uncharacterized protein n=1 Tax=Anguilla anguilla TaxID=7936 RepID=A0A0E9W011_ANGAN
MTSTKLLGTRSGTEMSSYFLRLTH